MTDIGSIRAFLTVDSTDYDQALDGAERKAEKSSKRIAKSFKKVGDGLSKIGKGLTVGLTLPLAAASAGFIKLASDAEETAGKFSVVFSSISTEANRMSEEMASSFGFAKDESQALLANTGDLLSGFGFTQQAALDMSVQVNQLAADLASFTNLEGGAERASKALTKALLGERESVKELGIAILESDVKARVLLNTQNGLIFATNRQARAQATLQLATEQSKNAIGDFARTQDSFANQMRIVAAEARDMAVAFGNQLLPIAKSLLAWSRDISAAWGELTPRTQRLAIVIGAVAAAAGPLLFIAGKIISGFGILIGMAGSLASGMASLGGIIATIASGPLLAIAAGIVLVVAATSDLIDWVGLLGSAWNFTVGIFRNIATFFGDFGKFFRDENAAIGENTRVAIEFIAKAWLSLRFAWNVVKNALLGTVQLITAGLERMVSAFAAVAEFVGMKDLAAGARDAAAALVGFVVATEDVQEANNKVLADIAKQWGSAPEALREDVNRLVDTFKAIPEGIISQIKSAFPGASEAIRGLVAQVQGFIDGGGVAPIEVPVQPVMGGGSADGEDQMNFLTALDTTTAEFMSMNEEITAIIDEIDAKWKDALTPDTAGIAAAWKGVASVYSSVFSQISSLYAKGSAEQRAFAVSSIILDTAIGIMKAMELPYPLNWVQAAAVGALGAIQLAKVGGGGGGAISSAPLSANDANAQITPLANQSQVVGSPDVADVGAFERVTKIIGNITLSDEEGNSLMSLLVDKANQGQGNGVQTLATVGG